MAKRKKLNPLKQVRQPLVDLSAYPVLTEEVGYPPSPIASQTGAPGSGAPSSSGSLGQIAAKAVADVLGWKIKPGDSKGFVGALSQSFTLTEFEGHVESKWTPRSYAVQTDLSGGITGAQASVYTRAKEALEQSLPLLEGLYTLDPEADPEDVVALKAVAKSQFTELVNEMGYVGGPRIQRIDQYFGLLLGNNSYPSPATPGAPVTVSDPDKIEGTLGHLRDLLGLNFERQDFVNSVDDETNLSNFRIVADYVTSLAQSWLNNLAFVGLKSKTPFYGTQLVLLSRQLMVVAESVDEVRFVLDSVFVGPAERQTMLLDFGDPTKPPMFLEDLLSWIRNFATDEGPRLIQDGGKFGVQNTFVPVAKQLAGLILAAPNGAATLPPAFSTPRVGLSLQDLADQLNELVNLASPIEHDITPQPDFALPFEVETVVPKTISATSPGQLFIRGSGFQSGAQVIPFLGKTTPFGKTFFRSESLLVWVPTAPTSGMTTVFPRGFAGVPLSSTSLPTLSVLVVNADNTQSIPLVAAVTVTP